MDEIFVHVAGKTLADLSGLHGYYRLKPEGDEMKNVPYVSIIRLPEGCYIWVQNKLEDLAEKIAAYLVFERQKERQNLESVLINFKAEGSEIVKGLSPEEMKQFYESLSAYADRKMPVPFGITFRPEPRSENLQDGIIIKIHR